jgi:hypothetical protein
MEYPTPGLDTTTHHHTPHHIILHHKTTKRDGLASILYDRLATRFPDFRSSDWYIASYKGTFLFPLGGFSLIIIYYDLQTLLGQPTHA